MYLTFVAFGGTRQTKCKGILKVSRICPNQSIHSFTVTLNLFSKFSCNLFIQCRNLSAIPFLLIRIKSKNMNGFYIILSLLFMFATCSPKTMVLFMSRPVHPTFKESIALGWSKTSGKLPGDIIHLHMNILATPHSSQRTHRAILSIKRTVITASL